MIDPVRATADDAVTSKLAASALGYYLDPFASRLAQSGPVPPKRMPIINRGTWTRVMAMDKVVDEFLCSSFEGHPCPRQIVSLGAGLDSRYFRFYERSQKVGGDQVTFSEDLNEGNNGAESTFMVNGKVIHKSLPRRRSLTTRCWAPGTVSYYEVDFPDIVARKRVSIQGNRALSKAAMINPGLSALASNTGSFKEEEDEEEEEEGVVEGGSTAAESDEPSQSNTKSNESDNKLVFGSYSLVSADLRDVAALDKALSEAGFDPRAPTLFLAECVLVYLPDSDASELLKWASGATSQAASLSNEANQGEEAQVQPPPRLFAAFEMTNPQDAFGKVMVANLRERGVDLHGMLAHPTLESQVSRFTSCGWSEAARCGWDMLTVYNSGLMDPVERSRIEAIEGLDELEEWELLMQHYCVCIAHSGPQVLPVFNTIASALDSTA